MAEAKKTRKSAGTKKTAAKKSAPKRAAKKAETKQTAAAKTQTKSKTASAGKAKAAPKASNANARQTGADAGQPLEFAQTVIDKMLEAQKMWLEITTKQTEIVVKTVSDVMNLSDNAPSEALSKLGANKCGRFYRSPAAMVADRSGAKRRDDEGGPNGRGSQKSRHSGSVAENRESGTRSDGADAFGVARFRAETKYTDARCGETEFESRTGFAGQRACRFRAAGGKFLR